MTQTSILHAIRSDERGFTLIEMVFVFVIFAIMATITLFNFRAFDQKITFNNLTDDIALRVVQAQKAAISGVTSVNFMGVGAKPAYGVFFKNTATATNAVDASQKHFVYFADIPIPTAPYNGITGDALYNAPASATCPTVAAAGNECVSVTALTTGEYISDICYVPSAGGSGTCGSYGLNIVFTRPFPDASLIITPATGSGAPIPARSACVELASPDTTIAKKTMLITNLGEIRIHSGVASGVPGCTT